MVSKSKSNASKLLLAGVAGAGLLVAGGSQAVAHADSVKVQKNDTVWALSQKYGVSIKSIESLNNINQNSHLIFVGQEINIPEKNNAEPKTSVSDKVKADSVTVKSGDSLSVIAQRYGVSVNALMQANHLTSSLILVGQQLNIPSGNTVSTHSTYVAPAAPASSAAKPQVQTPTSQATQSAASNSAAVSSAVQSSSAASQTPSSAVTSSAASSVAPSSVAPSSVATASSTQANSAASHSYSKPASAASSASVATNANQAASSAVPQISKQQQAASSVAPSSAPAATNHVASSVAPSSAPAATNHVASSAAPSSAPAATNHVASSAAPSSAPATTNHVASSAAPSNAAPAASTNHVASSAAPSSAPATTNHVASSAAPSNAAPAASTNHVASSAAPSSAATSNVQNTGSVTGLATSLANNTIPYVWGGKTPAGFDCSGFVSYIFQHAAGISLPSYTVAMESYVNKESASAAQPGDLLFWGTPGATYHVGIYLGNNQYASAPTFGQNVKVQTISSYFYPSFAGRVK
ncbi:LysM peptidoglycan-binding domain-containing protein [Pediococcus acidilactici]|uniref:LysM peptidoglycan-binding domain-containing protein n=1 Tax=Pediococcus acidilactici TaxID=1254 RepID=UPI001328B2C9|nr:LysM peptidoglycan-binding domain-containing protein [Pediococcus acidilactici]KAF0334305.1 LysM peptidoglycan-binding domain-containing protein [Pediococcus acidilactici]KAF0346263.1 LysM peptidoglycan-binding domain-containing protein [Pediococcus acidilactici]KAF0355984.1 LysM peptidoglycan-binding domain-containing protein [Pediococcus acidilactici]KAF0360423.1 LysM peptidoglycan-binding domain-containing protein [Pediococcus acidilactici]KAF0365082.1 LysM peptidoglycan-binding domain-c